MSNIFSFKEVIDYIEENLTENINIDILAKSAKMSVYEFRRIFSFVAGIPLSEYIRNRRLSAAAQELVTRDISVTDIGIKYGYDAPSSFTRAFKEFHGVSPIAIKEYDRINMFTKLDFKFNVAGGENIEYRIIEDNGFYVRGIRGVSDSSDTECCENVWNSFYESEKADDIVKHCMNKIYAVYDNGDNSVECTIGYRSDIGNSSMTYVPKSIWAGFTLKGAEDDKVNGFYKNIIFNWLESGKYKRNYNIPNLEVFPADMESDDFLWEIRIPITEEE